MDTNNSSNPPDRICRRRSARRRRAIPSPTSSEQSKSLLDGVSDKTCGPTRTAINDALTENPCTDPPPECNNNTPTSTPPTKTDSSATSSIETKQLLKEQPIEQNEAELTQKHESTLTVTGQSVLQAPPITTLTPIPVTATCDQLSTPEPINNNNETPSVNAVRVLFRDQQQQPRLQRDHSSQQIRQARGSQASIVSANRRLIERQIEAIQAADGRRWNFDFINCRPLGQDGLQWQTFNYQPRNCRPLNDQNQTAATPLDNQHNHQQQWRSPTGSGSVNFRRRLSDHKQDDV